MQPPLSLKAWTAEVVKMQQKYGAPIPRYPGPGVLPRRQLRCACRKRPQRVKSLRHQRKMKVLRKMATIYGCLSCHKEDVKVVGPAYKDVRAKYLHDPDAIEKVMAQIRHGGTGKWGTAVMPAFTAVGDADARRLAEWIMRLAAAV